MFSPYPSNSLLETSLPPVDVPEPPGVCRRFAPDLSRVISRMEGVDVFLSEMMQQTSGLSEGAGCNQAAAVRRPSEEQSQNQHLVPLRTPLLAP